MEHKSPESGESFPKKKKKRRKMCVISRIYLDIQHYFLIFVAEFATLYTVLCRIKDKNDVYTRKKRLDKLPLGHLAGLTPSRGRIP